MRKAEKTESARRALPDKDVSWDLPWPGVATTFQNAFSHPLLEFLRRITVDPAIPYPSSAHFHPSGDGARAPSTDGHTECNHASSAMIYAFCRSGITLRVHARAQTDYTTVQKYTTLHKYLETNYFSTSRVEFC